MNGPVPDLEASLRKNLIETYVRLGALAPGATVTFACGFHRCWSDLDLSFCNFALGFGVQADRVSTLIEELRKACMQRPQTRVFVMDGDRPQDLAERLESASFRISHRLVQMLCANPGGQRWVALQLPSEARSREAVATFMARQFFWRQNGVLRRCIVAATASSPHPLVCVGPPGAPSAAAMLARTPGVLGIYNVCVDPPLRRQGVGSRLVSALLAVAAEERVVATLQCAEGLEAWYTRLGFTKSGSVTAYRLVS